MVAATRQRNTARAEAAIEAGRTATENWTKQQKARQKTCVGARRLIASVHLMTGAHRRAVLAEVRGRLRQGLSFG
jgi:hypothetical protein